jgi:hypothetical protein
MTELRRLWKKLKTTWGNTTINITNLNLSTRKETKFYVMRKTFEPSDPRKKLALKLYRPFCILAKIGKSAYRLELQSCWQIHNIFHTSLLGLFWKNVIKGRSKIWPKPKEIEEEMEYELERILQSEVCTTHRKIGWRFKSFKRLYFLVKWKGYSDNECLWKPRMSLERASESIKEFYGGNHEAPAITTWGQVWRGGRVPVREIGKYNSSVVQITFHMTPK